MRERAGWVRRTRVRAGAAACLLLVGGCGGAEGRAAAADGECDPERGGVPVAAELAPFVETGAVPVCVLAADLNGDGRGDWLMVLERLLPQSPGQMEERRRTLLLVVRDGTGGLRLAVRSDDALFNSNYGGVNDPFAGVAAGTGSFQLLHYGGDAWRWERDFTFRYVPSRGTWELVEVFDRLSHAVGSEPSEEATFRAPGDFRGVGIEEFNVEGWTSRP